ncbi:hypothetical protein OHA72_47495 [Dactylosporangium sp. NBC_01737]|uniref:hypothetical protein n=1 Tax=Dactylosporangium sp. NBC_01737 TaxID=2975959 RepID=UPI002E161C85|nr:hypothetical protein OHA72_47495 [Dactylosporangium sp. NBC_01737]
MKDRQPMSNRASWVWPTVTVAVFLLGAVALCIVGLSAVIADYDGITSWINAVTLGSCCGVAVLVLLALPVSWFVHEAFRDR